MQRRDAMAIVASADASDLESAFDRLGHTQGHRLLRGPETGLVMVRGRIGGDGAAFNLGEVTVTRASVALDCGTVGHAYCLGSDSEHAVRAAVIDAIWQVDETRDTVEARVLQPLRAMRAKADRQMREETAATQVDFFTVARGEDA